MRRGSRSGGTAGIRFAVPAQADIRGVLATSEARWGEAARRRYRALLATAMARIAAEPATPPVVDRPDLRPGIRSYHIRHSRHASPEPPVASPVHVLFFRVVGPGLVEIVRVLHERADPARHMSRGPDEAL